MGILDFFKRKRNWDNLDKFLDRPTSSGINVTETVALGIPAVYACIRVLAESIASLPLITYERLPGGDKQRAQDFTLYPLLHDQPNLLMTSLELRELLMGHLCLRGNAYCLIEREAGEVVALWPLHPDRVKVEVDGRELIYTYQNDGQEKKYRMADILHIRALSSDGIMGYSPLALLRDSFGHAKAISDYSANYFKNDASPGGILSTPNTLNAAAAANLREAWNQGYRGSGNKHKVAVLDNDLKWQSVGVSPQDSQLIESQKFSVVEIARVFRVPLNLVMDYERSTYSNVTEQNRSFLTHTLTPWMERIEQAIHKSLLTESEKQKYFVEHLTQNFLKANTKERYEAYQIARDAGFMTVNEIRQLENMNSVEGGDNYETAPTKA
ncbi:MAG: phage portal protein [Proteobacteria bacterium]|nr:phage portal protein [Pseudomonadota bacterium]